MKTLSNRQPVAPRHHYIRLSNAHTGGFNPFDPDPIGALREAYAFITQPAMSTTTVIDGKTTRRAIYDTCNYDALVEMMGRAIRKAEPV